MLIAFSEENEVFDMKVRQLCAYSSEINSQQLTNQKQRQIAATYDIRCVFKKRLNFLNSAPTSIEIALRLLSAPRVRF
jgi:penicillin-binding protein-related factor A (putative recombinase)